MEDEQKRSVAIASLLLLGAGAAYIIKDDILEIMKNENQPSSENERKSVVKKETSKKIRSGKKKDSGEEKREKERVYHGITWDYFRKWLKRAYPGNNMRKIYPLLPEDFKMRWRKGIYRYGANTEAERAFVYYDSYFLGAHGFPDLYSKVFKYAARSIDFQDLLTEYREVLGIILKGAKV